MARLGSLLIPLTLFVSSSLSAASGPVPPDPLYIKTVNGYLGIYGVEDEYAEYALKGSEVRLQDPYHVQLKASLGLMVTYASRSQIGGGNDLLGDHLKWELDYWSKQAARVESVPRNDLSGGRDDLRVTEFRLSNGQGQRMNVYMIALAGKNGVFVVSISPADGSIDSTVREIAASFKLVHRPLDPDEVKRRSLEERAKQ